MDHLHAIKLVSRRTGLSHHVIRVWERRYGAVKPHRSGSNRRLYSDDEIARLQLLHAATRAGHSIGQIAQLPTEDLLRLVDSERVRKAGIVPPTPAKPKDGAQLVMDAMAALKALDGQALEDILNRAVMELGQSGLLQQIIVPLVEEIGNSWRDGRIKVAHEHVATAVIRTFLGNFSRPYALPETAPAVLATTPAGQLHELGAILVAAAANHHGWRVTYLGPSLPADEIAGAAIQNKVRAVALSIVYPEDDPHLPGELVRLRQLLPPEVVLLVGGRAARAYSESLDRIGAHLLENLRDFYQKLDDIRKPAAKR